MLPEPIALPISVTSPELQWSRPESQGYFDDWGTEVVWNVSQPSLLAFPAAEPNGSSIVIAPGGGYFGLSINSEGIDVARWLSANCGITAFVLKYRLLPVDLDQLDALDVDLDGWEEMTATIRQLATSDAATAMAYVRGHAGDYQIDRGRVGFMGFSAGATIGLGLVLSEDVDAEDRPDFVAPIYPRVFDHSAERQFPADVGPAFFVAAFDDELGFADDVLRAYRWWLHNQIPAELHLYAKGGHGFGLRPAGLPSDTWIARFADWFRSAGLAEADGATTDRA